MGCGGTVGTSAPMAATAVALRNRSMGTGLRESGATNWAQGAKQTSFGGKSLRARNAAAASSLPHEAHRPPHSRTSASPWLRPHIYNCKCNLYHWLTARCTSGKPLLAQISAAGKSMFGMSCC